jgi:hypothetical protein
MKRRFLEEPRGVNISHIHYRHENTKFSISYFRFLYSFVLAVEQIPESSAAQSTCIWKLPEFSYLIGLEPANSSTMLPRAPSEYHKNNILFYISLSRMR